jgi:hypothetical protein
MALMAREGIKKVKLRMIGRNDPCPCGSGIKYKKCHGRPSGSVAGPPNIPQARTKGDSTSVPPVPLGMIVKDRLRNETYSVGSPGVAVSTPVFTVGDRDLVLANPDDYIAALSVDLPFYLPIEEGSYDVMLSDRPVKMFHKICKRGAEEFSTLDTTELPYFSNLQIQMQPFADDLVAASHSISGEDLPQRRKSYCLILEVLEKLDGFLRINSKIRLPQEVLPKLSYRIGYFRRGAPRTQVAESVYVTSGTVRVFGPDSGLAIDNSALRTYLSQSVRVEAFAKQKIASSLTGKTFKEQIIIALHDFCYYCRQHARALAQLGEEQIRDLFLVVVKCLFGGGEGEVFHYDGKLDYKIINPINKYEFVTGEFKRWSGPASAADLYHQGVRKHATGQEAEIHLIMLNSNKDIRTMAEEYWRSVAAEPDTKAESRFALGLPAGSKERFAGFVVEIRGESVPLITVVADMYHERA